MIVTCADVVAPIINIVKTSSSEKQRNFIPPSVITKINKQKRFLKLDKFRNSNAHCSEIKQLSLDIRAHFKTMKDCCESGCDGY